MLGEGEAEKNRSPASPRLDEEQRGACSKSKSRGIAAPPGTRTIAGFV